MKIVKILIFTGILSTSSACLAISDFTSSTLDTATPDVVLNNFIDKRYDAIRRDAAAGGGENIDALASIMGQIDSQALGLWMQANYGKLFSERHRATGLQSRIEQYWQQKNKG